LPRFWGVDRYEVETNADHILDRMLSPDFDPAREIVLEEEPSFPIEAGEGEPAIIRSYDYDANEIRVVVDAGRPCLLVHSENWFPYWHAFRSGVELPIYRANGVIRAIPIPAGRSEIVFRFVSRPFEVGMSITWAAVGLFVLTLLGLRLRKRN
jgi:hypothetical protein